MEGKNVFVVVDIDGRLLPYIAEDIGEALKQHDADDGAEIEGIFVYGATRVGVI
ncbi:hypothetical protein SEA_SHAM4_75 [Mycobacterium phage Sham4]|uniref:hypothetical protein n=1 Tax=Mycobacterium phage Mulciber TaxID=1805459 RepID=UPI00078CB397|nr:hypothetical protein BJD74_gp31 [Mycobacterium phage Mulciber]AQT28250.1 hypothetical protein SEA_JABITH_78 [Mycobacterium phage Jabith]ASR86716.1 hypothetical protein SEA_ET2BRUTUS_78 [Mycobacterium phage Et2Brutus]AXC33437.1 hypothetical protein SEA_EBONY_79 [Mycobacterium phage Ebony]AXC33536.1 hypothetical protein SEA_JOSELITO_78 [Mycobacterium phage Joselito]AXH50758.1 hypothetical protein SEA_SNAPE_79 [Mycobacterium phage Snape]QBI97905.1 hypothetical protein SEA_ORANGE_79 [Mycobacte